MLQEQTQTMMKETPIDEQSPKLPAIEPRLGRAQHATACHSVGILRCQMSDAPEWRQLSRARTGQATNLWAVDALPRSCHVRELAAAAERAGCGVEAGLGAAAGALHTGRVASPRLELARRAGQTGSVALSFGCRAGSATLTNRRACVSRSSEHERSRNAASKRTARYHCSRRNGRTGKARKQESPRWLRRFPVRTVAAAARLGRRTLVGRPANSTAARQGLPADPCSCRRSQPRAERHPQRRTQPHRRTQQQTREHRTSLHKES